jgi:hypothetical protein
MSRTIVKIETGLAGMALMLAVIFWSSVHADSASRKRIFFLGRPISPHTAEILSAMKLEMREISRLLVAEPGCLMFETKQGDILKYHFDCQALWRNDIPVIPELESFHFEFRDLAGNLMQPDGESFNRIHSIFFMMKLNVKKRPVFTDGRVYLDYYNESFHGIDARNTLAKID